MEMSIDPAVAGIGTEIAAAAAQGLSAGAVAAPSVAALAPAGADAVSLQAVSAFAAEAAAIMAANTAAQEELARVGAALTDIARTYTDVDGVSAGALSARAPELSPVFEPISQVLEPTGIPAAIGELPAQLEGLAAELASPISGAAQAAAAGTATATQLATGVGIPPAGLASPAAHAAAATPGLVPGLATGVAAGVAASPGAAVGGAAPGAVATPGLPPGSAVPEPGVPPGGVASPGAPGGAGAAEGALGPAVREVGVPAAGVVAPLGRAAGDMPPDRAPAPPREAGRPRRRLGVEMFALDGKRALVTGASSALGRIVALAYLQAGAHVAVADRDPQMLDDVVADLAAAGAGTVLPLGFDPADPAEATALLGRATAELGGVDIVVCNPGLGPANGLLDMGLEEFQRSQHVGVTGVFLVAQAAARAMTQQGRGGSIIITSSMPHPVDGTRPAGPPRIAEAAVVQLTRSLAVELAPDDIRVNSVSPGYFRDAPESPAADPRRPVSAIPLGRAGRPDELAGLYIYLASDASSYMTGSDIVIDGGCACL